MNIAALITLLTTLFSIAVKVVGMPDQIRSNYRQKSTAGLSSWFMVSTLLSYTLWVVHGIQVHDIALIVGQGLGVLVTGVIVGQMLAYRKNPLKVKIVKPRLLWYSALLKKAAFQKNDKS